MIATKYDLIVHLQNCEMSLSVVTNILNKRGVEVTFTQFAVRLNQHELPYPFPVSTFWRKAKYEIEAKEGALANLLGFSLPLNVKVGDLTLIEDRSEEWFVEAYLLQEEKLRKTRWLIKKEGCVCTQQQEKETPK